MLNNRKSFATLASVALLGLASLIASSPATAADVGTLEIDCGDGSPLPGNISGVVGDTFALSDDDDSPGDCTNVAASPTGIVAWSLTPGGTDNPSTLPGTGGAGGRGQIFYFTILAAGTTDVSFDYIGGAATFTVTATEAETSSATTGPTMQLQQLPIPASGDCADADPNNALWAKSNSTPWTVQWGEWSEPVPFSGWVCGRWVWANGTG